MEKRTADAIAYIKSHHYNAAPSLIGDYGGTQCLVFYWNYFMATYPVTEIIEGLCARMEVRCPNEIPVYFLVRTASTDYLDQYMADRAAMRDYFERSHEEIDPLPDPPCDMLIDDITYNKNPSRLRCVISRNRKLRADLRKIRKVACVGLYEYLDSLIDLDVRVPLHVVTSVRELIERNMRDTVFVLYSLCTTCCLTIGQHEYAEFKDATNSRMFLNDAASLIDASMHSQICTTETPNFAIGVPRRPILTRIISHHDTYVMTTLDLDGIRDAICADGWSTEIKRTIREQLKVDKYYDYALSRFLRNEIGIAIEEI